MLKITLIFKKESRNHNTNYTHVSIYFNEYFTSNFKILKKIIMNSFPYCYVTVLSKMFLGDKIKLSFKLNL